MRYLGSIGKMSSISVKGSTFKDSFYVFMDIFKLFYAPAIFLFNEFINVSYIKNSRP